jgi:ATP-dependent DNA helicase RecG
MFRELLRSGHGTPTISQTVDSTRVALVGGAPRTQVVRYVEQLDAQERDDVDTLLVVFTMLSTRTITAPDLSGVIQKSEAEADALLRRLAGDRPGILEPTRESARLRRPEYRLRGSVIAALGSSVSYHRRTVDDIDRKVIAHVLEYGRISNRTIQNLLDIDVYRARDLLRDLRDRGLLVKTSTQERGIAVEYGPGAKFPHPKRQRTPRDSEPPGDDTLFGGD